MVVGGGGEGLAAGKDYGKNDIFLSLRTPVIQKCFVMAILLDAMEDARIQ